METRDRVKESRVFRIVTDRLIPLEIWDGLIGSSRLDLLPQTAQPQGLHEFLWQLQQGRARRRNLSDSFELRTAKDFKRVVLVGGRAESLWRKLAPFAKTFDILRCESPDRAFDCDLALDWGQSQTKIYTLNSVETRLRNFEEFPLIDSSVHTETPEEVNVFFEKFNRQLRGILASNPQATRVRLALPTRISSDGLAETCTYCGLKGDLLSRIEPPEAVSIELMNDAEFAALWVKKSGLVEEKTLVVTCGFGFGASLWEA